MAMAAMLSISLMASAQDATLQKMEGKWTYTIPDMGDMGSIECQCVIATADGETKASISNAMGAIVSSPLQADNGKYVGTLAIENDMGSFQMKIAFYFEGDKLMQELSFDMGVIPAFEMTRIE
jgi:hypothetical protein